MSGLMSEATIKLDSKQNSKSYDEGGLHTTVIEAGQSSHHYWRDLWRQRELLYYLAWRDLIVRYKQTVVGILWVLLRPLLTLIIFSLVFGKWAALSSSSKGLPYPLLVFAGLLPWNFFSSVVSDCSNSVLGNGSLIGKVYFPRLIIPFSALMVCFVDFMVSCLLIIVIGMWTGTMPDIRILLLPILTLWVGALGLGIGVWGAALNVRYRDIRHLIPFLLQLGLFASPVGYSTTIVPARWQFLYSINPMVGIIDSFRWAILGKRFDAYLPGLTLSIMITIIVLTTGIMYFRKSENKFVDYI